MERNVWSHIAVLNMLQEAGCGVRRGKNMFFEGGFLANT